MSGALSLTTSSPSGAAAPTDSPNMGPIAPRVDDGGTDVTLHQLPDGNLVTSDGEVFGAGDLAAACAHQAEIDAAAAAQQAFLAAHLDSMVSTGAAASAIRQLDGSGTDTAVAGGHELQTSAMSTVHDILRGDQLGHALLAAGLGPTDPTPTGTHEVLLGSALGPLHDAAPTLDQSLIDLGAPGHAPGIAPDPVPVEDDLTPSPTSQDND